jgi:GxxExxY protein
MTKKDITSLSYAIVGLAIKVHKELGPGLLESVYEECLKYELEKHGYKVLQQKIVPVFYDGIQMETNLRFDLLVEEVVLIELKATEKILPVYEAQILTYMKLLKVPQGLLINFFTDNITKSMKPFVNDIFKNLPDGE